MTYIVLLWASFTSTPHGMPLYRYWDYVEKSQHCLIFEITLKTSFIESNKLFRFKKIVKKKS